MALSARRRFLPSLLLLLCGAWAIQASPPEATQTARTPQFENDEVKVWKSVILPNDPLPPHRHEHPRVIVALTGGR